MKLAEERVRSFEVYIADGLGQVGDLELNAAGHRVDMQQVVSEER